MFLDTFFGTCVYSMADKDKGGVTARADPKAVLGAPTVEGGTYLFLIVACLAIWAQAALHPISSFTAFIFALIGGCGPIAVAWIMWQLRRSGWTATPTTMSAPWQLVHLILAAIFAIAPVPYAMYLAGAPLA